MARVACLSVECFAARAIELSFVALGISVLLGRRFLMNGASMRATLIKLEEKWRMWRGSPQPGSRSRISTSFERREQPLANAGLFAAISAFPDAALVLDEELTLVHGNSLAQLHLGTLSIGSHITSTCRHPSLIAAVREAQRLRGPVDFEVVFHGGVEKRFMGRASLLLDKGRTGGKQTLMVILQDLTEKDALARMRVEFIANASHELRTPLTSLIGFIETLRGPAKDDQAARSRFLELMAKQAARMSRLIDDLLSLSRVEMHVHVMPTGLVELNLLLDDAIETIRRSATEAKIQILAEPWPDSLMVRGDHDELVQALQNLIQNAIKYGRDQGTVSVVVRPSATRIDGRKTATVAVSDDGPGISSEHIPRLTERFFRVSQPRHRDKTGTGLGLAIVKHIVTRHGGTLEISSEVGVGSTFAMVLPLVEGAGRSQEHMATVV
jgi:two-component system, OmpR family, phosphate regulon sensor histidine kinase PhoR